MSTKRTKGTREVPYTKAEYDKMVVDSSWIGGWVDRGDKTVYITARGSVEQDIGTRTLGSKENPFSDQAYYEMDVREEFVGGYVRFEGVDEPLYRYPSGETESDGSGCGSALGCGCGCGVGCGSGSGTIRLTPGSELIALPEGGSLTVSWDVESNVSVKDTSTGSSVNFVQNGYDLVIEYGGFEIHYTIPKFYRVDDDGYENKP